MGVEKLDQRSQAERTDQGAQPQQPAQQKSQQCAQRIRKKAAAEIGEWRVVPQAQRQVIIRGNPQIGGLVQRNAK